MIMISSTGTDMSINNSVEDIDDMDDALSILLRELAFSNANHGVHNTATYDRDVDGLPCKVNKGGEWDRACDETIPTAEVQSEDTLYSGNIISSEQLLRDSIDDALTTLKTITSSPPPSEDMADSSSMGDESNDILYLDPIFDPYLSPNFDWESDGGDLPPAWLQIPNTGDLRSNSASNMQLFDDVDYTLENMETVIEFVVGKEQSLYHNIQQKENLIQGQAQSLRDMSITIHNLNLELAKTKEILQETACQRDDLEMRLQSTIQRETDTRHMVELVQNSLQAREDELALRQQADNRIQSELNTAYNQIQFFDEEVQRLHHTIQALRNELDMVNQEKDVNIQRSEQETLRLTAQITDERRHHKETLDKCATLETIIQQYKSSTQTMEQQYQATRGIIQSREKVIETKDHEIRSRQLLLKQHTCTHDEYEHEIKENNYLMLETVRLNEADLQNTLEHTPCSCETRNFEKLTSDRNTDNTEPMGPTRSSLAMTLEEHLVSNDCQQSIYHTNMTNMNKTDDHNDLLVDAEHVIQSLELKITTLEKTVQALTKERFENSSSLKEGSDPPVYNTHYSFEIDIDELLVHEDTPLPVAEIDLVSLHEASLEHPGSHTTTNHILLSLENETHMRTSSDTKDSLIKTLLEQVFRLKTALEDILDSERSFGDECQRQLIEAEEKCLSLTQERDALLALSLKRVLHPLVESDD